LSGGSWQGCKGFAKHFISHIFHSRAKGKKCYQSLWFCQVLGGGGVLKNYEEKWYFGHVAAFGWQRSMCKMHCMEAAPLIEGLAVLF